MNPDKQIKIEKDGVVVWNENGINTHAWVNGGCPAWFIREGEKTLPPEELFELIKNKWQNGEVYRCTTCGAEMLKKDVAGWPLFAGVACETHWKEHQRLLANERAKGAVCSMCGQPYSNCCC